MSKLRSNVAFVRLILGRLVTNAGDSLYFVGAMWLVYHLTGSSLYTGIVGFLVQLPTSVQFLFGPLVDRWRLRRVLVGTQLVQGVFVLVVPLAAATGHLSVWVVLAVMPVLSLVNQMVYPAQTAALPRIVDEEQLVRANSLFSTAYQGTEVVFNAAGGAVLAVVGATTLFVVDSVTFAAATLLFVGLTVPAVDDASDEDDAADERYLEDLREGIDYLRGSVVVSMVLGAMVSNFGAGAAMAVLPAFADSLGGPETYGLLMAALAGGNLLGAAAASLVENRSYGYFSVVGFVSAGCCLFAALTVRGPLATTVLLFASVAPVGAFNVMFSSMLQSSVDDALLGRVSAVVSSLTAAMMPVGNLLGGAAGEAFGPGSVLSLFSGLLVVLGCYYLVHPKIRSLPSVAETDEVMLGLQPPSES